MIQLRNIALVLGVLFFLTPAVWADSSRFEVAVQPPFTPVTATGIVITNEGVLQAPGARIEQKGENKFTVNFGYDLGIYSGDIFTSAMLISKDGEQHFADVQQASLEGNKSYLSIPKCDTRQHDANSLVHGQLGLLQSLIEVRTARRKFLQVKTSEMLNTDFKMKVVKVEKGFGINSGAEILNDKMPPYELIDRLQRVVQGIKNFQHYKNKN